MNILVALSTLALIKALEDEYHRKIVDFVNNSSFTWKAKLNADADSFEVVSKHFGHEGNEIKSYNFTEDVKLQDGLEDTWLHMISLLRQNISLPTEYDPRKSWSQCASVHQVFNQGGCGSCWAGSSSAVMSDRVCIASKGKKQLIISVEDLLSCCKNCGSGCQGSANPITPFEHWKHEGIVSGGAYGSKEGCKPYSFPSDCGAPCSIDHYKDAKTPNCSKTCRPDYNSTYDADLNFGKSSYYLRLPFYYSQKKVNKIMDSYLETNNMTRTEVLVQLMKTDLFLHGPLYACYTIREDFLHYHSGIYYSQQGMGRLFFGHCVRLLGWGQEGSREYWIYANTWGETWGENGFFRVHIADLPREISAGLPLL